MSTPTYFSPFVSTFTLLVFALCVFFFERYGAHQSLHSFPTRRSSDLQVKNRSDSVGYFGAVFARKEIAFDHANSRSKAISFLDRKSTRLNSSHGYNSYAVFCLKKKRLELVSETSHRDLDEMDMAANDT